MPDHNDLMSEVLVIAHQVAIENAKKSVAYIKTLSPTVLEETRSQVLARDDKGRITNTSTVKIPQHNRDYDAIAQQHMARYRKSAPIGVSHYYAMMSPVWKSNALSRLKFLATAPSLGAWVAKCDEWKVTEQPMLSRMNKMAGALLADVVKFKSKAA